MSRLVSILAGVVAATALLLPGCDATFVDQRPERPDAGGLDAGGLDAGGLDAGGLDAGSQDVGTVDGSGIVVDGGGEVVVIARGSFSGRGGYQATGRAELRRVDGRVELYFTTDFSASAVPGPVVLLTERAEVGTAIDADQGDLELGVLEDVSGEQSYEIAGSDAGRRYAWVYCKPFGVEVARALMEDVP